MKQEIVKALMHDAEAGRFIAETDIKILLNNPVGVGDHPNVLETIQGKLDELCKHKDRLDALALYFYEED